MANVTLHGHSRNGLSVADLDFRFWWLHTHMLHIQNSSNCCSYKYDQSISRFFFFLLTFGRILLFGQTVCCCRLRQIDTIGKHFSHWVIAWFHISLCGDPINCTFWHRASGVTIVLLQPSQNSVPLIDWSDFITATVWQILNMKHKYMQSPETEM